MERKKFSHVAMVAKTTVIGGQMGLARPDIHEIPGQGAKLGGVTGTEQNDTFRGAGSAQDLSGQEIEGGNAHASAHQTDRLSSGELKTVAQRPGQVYLSTGSHGGQQAGAFADNLIKKLDLFVADGLVDGQGPSEKGIVTKGGPDHDKLAGAGIGGDFRGSQGQPEYLRRELFLAENFRLFFILIHF
jgi:hypothetical protein